MLKIKIELNNTVVAEGTITNTGEGTPSKGTYRVCLLDKDGRVWKCGNVKNFPRKKLLAWDLLLRALVNTIGIRE
jgi:hypothetical protein